MVNKNVLLVSGGTGSFGNAVLNRFVDTEEFSEIRIFSRNKKNKIIFEKK
jgi:UDP-glucose 4-epimerase